MRKTPFDISTAAASALTAAVLLCGVGLAIAPVQDSAAPSQEPAPSEGPAAVQETRVPTLQEATGLMNAGDLAGARDAFAKISAAQPENAQAVFLHAYTLHATGDLDAAHDRHLAAARFEQFRPIALYNHACVHALRGETDLAIASLREAVEAGFSDANQVAIDDDMKGIRDDPRVQVLLLEMQGDSFNGIALTDLADLPAERRFDFYLGTWAMMNGEAVEQTLVVERAFEGRGLTVASKDPTGREAATSTYVYDDTAQSWRQAWAHRSGQLITMAGGLKAIETHGAQGIALDVQTDSRGTALDGRSVFIPRSKDEVTYLWQVPGSGEPWVTAAERTLVRR